MQQCMFRSLCFSSVIPVVPSLLVSGTSGLHFRQQTCGALSMSTDGSRAKPLRAPQGNGGKPQGSGARRRRRNGKDGPKRSNGEKKAPFAGDPMAGPQLIPKPAPVTYENTGTVVLWFRNDLRLHDNAALELANTAARIVPVYVFDERAYGMEHASPHGFQRTGPYRAKFVVESVTVLRRALRWKMSDLIVRLGFTEEVIGEVVEDLVSAGLGPVRVVAHKESTREETDMESAVDEAARSAGGEGANFVWGSTLLHPDDLKFNPIGPALPNTFTEFRKRVEAEPVVAVRPEIQTPTEIRTFPREVGLESDDIPSLGEDLGVQGLAAPHDYAFPHPLAVMTFRGGEDEANERVNDWFFKKKCLGTYFETRNDSGSKDFSTKLSPWLALGCISPRTVYWACKKYEEKFEANKSTYWVVFELLTRDYFRWVTGRAGNKVFALNGFTGRGEGDRDVWRLPEGAITEEHKRRFNAWMEGETGAPFVDAHMRELASTGFMSNRGRQNVASFLIHDLAYPDWRAGAEYFESQLIDHDVASNWGNWAYLAGVGSDPRGGRRFNVVKQAHEYDKSGWYTTRWCGELIRIPPPYIHEPHLLSEEELDAVGVVRGVSYPLPIVPLLRGPKPVESFSSAATIGSHVLPVEDPDISQEEKRKMREEAARAVDELCVGAGEPVDPEEGLKIAEAEEAARLEAEKFS